VSVARELAARGGMFMLLAGVAVSVMVTGRLTLRIILPVMVYASFIPLLQILSVALVRGSVPWRKAAAVFLRGHLPWTMWILASAALFGLVPADRAFGYSTAWRFSIVAPLVCSAWIDYGFFRRAIGASPRGALWRLAVQRTICWIPGAAIFVAPAGWQVVASALGI
jgi:hypothetical protein